MHCEQRNGQWKYASYFFFFLDSHSAVNASKIQTTLKILCPFTQWAWWTQTPKKITSSFDCSKSTHDGATSHRMCIECEHFAFANSFEICDSSLFLSLFLLSHILCWCSWCWCCCLYCVACNGQKRIHEPKHISLDDMRALMRRTNSESITTFTHTYIHGFTFHRHSLWHGVAILW